MADTIKLDIPKSSAERVARTSALQILQWFKDGSFNNEQAVQALINWRDCTHPPTVGADVREALEESSQTLKYLRREARTWGKIFSVNVDHVLDKNRKALSALTRPLGGFVQGSIARKPSPSSTSATATETALDILEQNCWDLRCVDIPTGAGDADIGWRVVEHHMAPPKERINGYGNAPLDALMDAMTRGPK